MQINLTEEALCKTFQEIPDNYYKAKHVNAVKTF